MKVKLKSFRNWGIMWKIMSISLAMMVLILSGILFYLFPKIENQLLQEKSTGIRNVVEAVHFQVKGYEKRVNSGELFVDDAKMLALEGIESMRYDGTNYIWINDLACRMVMHPINRDLNGQDMQDYRDPKGKRIFVEFVEMAQASEEGGTVSYMWPRPGSDKPVSKVSFVKLYQPWGWVIGSGVYVDDVEAEMAGLRNSFMLAAIAALALVMVLALLVSRFITRPIRQVVSAADQLAAGDLSVALTATSSDEIGQLMDAIDNMASMLKARENVAQEIADGNLSVTVSVASEQDSLGKAMVKMQQSIAALVAETKKLLAAAQAESFDVRGDAATLDGEYRNIIEGINNTLDVVVEKMFWYESILDSIPFPLSVTDLDMNWTFVNRPVENLLKTSRKEIFGKHCSHWGAQICNTEDCGIASLRRKRPTTFFDQFDKNFQVDTSFILNSRGEKIGHIEGVQDITKIAKVTEYSRQQVERLASTMARVAQGDLTVAFDLTEADAQGDGRYQQILSRDFENHQIHR